MGCAKVRGAPSCACNTVQGLVLLFSGFCEALLVDPGVVLLRPPQNLFNLLPPASLDLDERAFRTRAIFFSESEGPSDGSAWLTVRSGPFSPGPPSSSAEGPLRTIVQAVPPFLTRF